MWYGNMTIFKLHLTYLTVKFSFYFLLISSELPIQNPLKIDESATIFKGFYVGKLLVKIFLSLIKAYNLKKNYY